MFANMLKVVVKEGHGEEMVKQYSARRKILSQQEGFVDLKVMKNQSRGDEEILVIAFWESKEAWKNWEKSPTHLAAHKAAAGKPKPDFILSHEGARFDVAPVAE